MLKNGKKNNPSKIEVEMWWKCSQNILAKQISPKKGTTKQNVFLKFFGCEISHKKTAESTMASSTFQCWILFYFDIFMLKNETFKKNL